MPPEKTDSDSDEIRVPETLTEHEKQGEELANADSDIEKLTKEFRTWQQNLMRTLSTLAEQQKNCHESILQKLDSQPPAVDVVAIAPEPIPTEPISETLPESETAREPQNDAADRPAARTKQNKKRTRLL